jgi:hypothetical protein
MSKPKTETETIAQQKFVLDVPEENSLKLFESSGERLIEQWIKGIGPDTLRLQTPKGTGKINDIMFDLPQIDVPATFFPLNRAIHCMVADEPSTFNLHPDIPDIQAWLKSIEKRNKAADFKWPASLKKEIEGAAASKVAEYPIQTSQEWQATLQAVGDGKHGLYLLEDDQSGTLRHQRPGAPFYVEAKLTEEEINAGHSIDLLRSAMRELDIDSGYIMLYVSQCLAPVCELPKNTAAAAWLDLDDVARKTLGGYAPNPKVLEERRLKVWNALQFGARWFIGGQRSIQYQEKQTGRTIDTKIYTSPWQITQREEDVQTVLFPESSVPLRVELVASRPWTALTTSPDTAQFLRIGELFGSIPPGQAKGDWARSTGMSYCIWARVKMATALKGGKTLTRRELLDFLPPKTVTYRELLGTTHAGRIYEYWRGAEDFLIEREIITIPAKREPKPSGAKEWNKWLDSSPPWRPGAAFLAALEEQRGNLYIPKPRQLNPAKRKRRATTAKRAKSLS